jgi:hypothetical protein
MGHVDDERDAAFLHAKRGRNGRSAKNVQARYLPFGADAVHERSQAERLARRPQRFGEVSNPSARRSSVCPYDRDGAVPVHDEPGHSIAFAM